MKTKYLFLTAFFSVCWISCYGQSPREITNHSIEAVDLSAMETTMTLTIRDGRGNERIRQFSNTTKTFGEVTKTLMRFIYPTDVKGTSLLIYDYVNKSDDMWIYMPALRRSRRIISNEKGKSFMGSEFSYADMSKPNLDDFSYRLSGDMNLNGKSCWTIEATCVNNTIEDENGFSKKIIWIEKETFLTYQVEYYDRNGDIIKIMTLNNYHQLGKDKYMAYEMQIENVKTKRESVIAIEKFQNGSDLDENSFEVTNLEK